MNTACSLILILETVAGHPVAWVNNQYQQYVYDVTDLILSPIDNDTNLTVALESAWYYGLNVTARPDAERLAAIDVSACVSKVMRLR